MFVCVSVVKNTQEQQNKLNKQTKCCCLFVRVVCVCVFVRVSIRMNASNWSPGDCDLMDVSASDCITLGSWGPSIPAGLTRTDCCVHCHACCVVYTDMSSSSSGNMQQQIGTWIDVHVCDFNYRDLAFGMSSFSDTMRSPANVTGTGRSFSLCLCVCCVQSFSSP